MTRNSDLIAISQQIRQARLIKGISRRELAGLIKVDVTAIIAWESGKYLPRDTHRIALARHLDLNLLNLYSAPPHNQHLDQLWAKSTSFTQLCRQSFGEMVRNCKKQIKVLKLSYPYASNNASECDYCESLSRRILADDLEVRCVEIFYSPQRLQQAMANTLRYEGHSYTAKTFAACSKGVFPGIDFFIFDDVEIVMASFWAIEALDERPILHMRGEPFQVFIQEYWNEVWRHAIPLNPNFSTNIGAFRDIARALGQTKSQWERMQKDAYNTQQNSGGHILLW